MTNEVNIMNDDLEEVLRQFTGDVRSLYDDALLAVVLYGSAASDEYVKGRSNINCLILLKEVTPPQLKKSSGYIKQWRANGIATPLFVDPAYVHASLDVFPIEFLDMKQRYRVMHGQDFLRDLNIDLQHLRFQCEQELKGKMLKLRQFYLEGFGSEIRLTALLTKSISTFMVLFRALLHLKQPAAPQSADQILAGLSRLGLPVAAMKSVYGMKREELKVGAVELDALFAKYLSEIQTAIEYVDKITVQ
jgi:hypothetical protein